MTTMDDKAMIDALSSVDLPEKDIPLDRLGITIVVRALSHDEALVLKDYGQKNEVTSAQYEQRMLSMALVTPKMSTGQIKAWQKASPAGELERVTSVVVALSGMGKDSAKEAYKSTPEEPGTGE